MYIRIYVYIIRVHACTHAYIHASRPIELSRVLGEGGACACACVRPILGAMCACIYMCTDIVVTGLCETAILYIFLNSTVMFLSLT